MSDDALLAEILRRLLDEGCWSTADDLTSRADGRRMIAVDASLYDLTAEEVSAVCRYFDSRITPLMGQR